MMASLLKSNYPQIARESGFRLRQYKDGPIDWRLIGSMEIDRILGEQQFEHIDAILLHLSEAPLSTMLDSNILDSAVAKYFTISQFALQYMIFCRKFLDESVKTLRENIIKLETQNLHLRTINQEHTDNILHLNKKLNQVEAIHEIVYPCNACTKNFVSNDALNIHLSKKHLKNTSIDIHGKNKDQTLINTIKLELEIKQLKDRLNIAEKYIRQTNEMKNASLRGITKLNSSTQVEISTQNVGTHTNIDKTTRNNNYLVDKEVGTQCNLFETKEFDCTENLEKHSIFNFPKETKCDVNNVAASNVEILFDIQTKISKLEALQETLRSGNQQSINEIKHKLGDITEFLEIQARKENVPKGDILPSTCYQMLPLTSIDEFNTILSSMVTEFSQMKFEIISRINTGIEENTTTFQTENEKHENAHPHASKQINAPIKNKISSSELSKTTSNINGTIKYTLSDSQSDSFSSNNISKFESHRSMPLTKEEVSDQSISFNKFVNKMSLYGLNINSKSISLSEANKISRNLLEQRNLFHQVYPTFYKTRNRLNKLVELLICEEHSYSDRINNHIKNDKLIEMAKPKRVLKLKMDSNKGAKKHIETILKPHTKQPTIYVTSRSKDEIKPIPFPRKHVVFHTNK